MDNINDNLYHNYNINSKNPILELGYHNSSVNCFAILDDGRLVSGSLVKILQSIIKKLTNLI